MSKATDVYRTYYNKKRNISKSAKTIHKYLFSHKKSVSDKGAKDAKILNEFFKQLKQLSNMPKTDIGTTAKSVLLGKEIESIPIIDFTKGGTAFEIELLKLFKGLVNKETGEVQVQNLGQQTAQVYIDTGKTSADAAIETILGEDLNKISNTIVDEVRNNIVSNKEVNSGYPTGYSLKVGAKRMGKIDVYNNTGADLDISFEGKPTGDLATALKLLKQSTFSVKSYVTSGQIHLGRTNKKKAVSAVSEYVAEKYDANARWAGIYYYRHPENKGTLETAKARDELYEHYDHMHKVFELTGIGLRYDDLSDLYSVDFLLVNRASSDSDIYVYSTQDLVKQLGETGKYNI